MAIDRENLPIGVDDELDRLERIEEAAGQIADRTPIDDAALHLRAALTQDGILNSEWLPEPLASERAEETL